MQGATHFIEVWQGRINGTMYTERIMPISVLPVSLRATANWGNTVFVWRIKPKSPIQN